VAETEEMKMRRRRRKRAVQSQCGGRTTEHK